MLLIVALAWTAGRLSLPLLLLQPVVASIALGNIEILMAAAIVAGFRYPATWSFILLSKVTPGVGLVWFAVRREWRSLGIALGVTAIIVAVSFVLAPQLWADWLALLGRNNAADFRLPVVPGSARPARRDRGRAHRLGRPDGPALDGPGRGRAGRPGRLLHALRDRGRRRRRHRDPDAGLHDPGHDHRRHRLAHAGGPASPRGGDPMTAPERTGRRARAPGARRRAARTCAARSAGIRAAIALDRSLVAAFVVSRLLVLAAAVAAETLIVRNPALTSGDGAPILRSLTSWDGKFLLGIVRDGYHAAAVTGTYHDYAFLPLYPAIVRVLSAPWPAFAGLVAVLVSNVAFLIVARPPRLARREGRRARTRPHRCPVPRGLPVLVPSSPCRTRRACSSCSPSARSSPRSAIAGPWPASCSGWPA